MAPRLLTRWICVCIALPAGIVLSLFHVFLPWDIPKNINIAPNILSSLPRAPDLRSPGYRSPTQRPQDPSYALILPVESGDDLIWLPSQLTKSDHFRVVSYVLNDRHSPNSVPSERGGPVIAFLSYIVQHYDDDGLADINVFMLGKQLGTYNDDILSNDASKILDRLRPEHVLEIGFANLACELGNRTSTTKRTKGGCRVLGLGQNDAGDATSGIVKKAWPTLFPGTHLPRCLSVVSGGQFAASRSSIRKVPKTTWLNLEQYVITTDLSDNQILDLFSALWQYIFTGITDSCPNPQKCYCGLYAICFASTDEYNKYVELKIHYKELEPSYDDILAAHHRIERARERQRDRLAAWISGAREESNDVPDPWKTEEGLLLRKRIGQVSQNLWRIRNKAWRRGDELFHLS